MTDEKTCYNCGNKNCNVYYSMVKKDYKKHFETYEYKNFDCVNHNKWEELKMEEIHTDNTKTLQNALDRIEELEQQIEKMKCCGNCKYFKFQDDGYYTCIKDGNCNGKNYRSCEFNLEKWELKEIKEND